MVLKDKCFAKPRAAEEVTRFLYVAGVGDQMGTDPEQLRRFFASFGDLDADFCAVDVDPEQSSENASGDAVDTNATEEGPPSARAMESADAATGAIVMIENRRYCYVVYVSAASAQSAHHFCRLSVVEQQEIDPERFALLQRLGASKLCVKFASTKRPYKAPPEMECTSSTAHVQVPGLHLLEEYVSEGEEAALLAELGGDDAPWKDSILRRVQVQWSLLT